MFTIHCCGQQSEKFTHKQEVLASYGLLLLFRQPPSLDSKLQLTARNTSGLFLVGPQLLTGNYSCLYQSLACYDLIWDILDSFSYWKFFSFHFCFLTLGVPFPLAFCSVKVFGVYQLRLQKAVCGE